MSSNGLMSPYASMSIDRLRSSIDRPEIIRVTRIDPSKRVLFTIAEEHADECAMHDEFAVEAADKVDDGDLSSITDTSATSDSEDDWVAQIELEFEAVDTAPFGIFEDATTTETPLIDDTENAKDDVSAHSNLVPWAACDPYHIFSSHDPKVPSIVVHQPDAQDMVSRYRRNARRHAIPWAMPIECRALPDAYFDRGTYLWCIGSAFFRPVVYLHHPTKSSPSAPTPTKAIATSSRSASTYSPVLREFDSASLFPTRSKGKGKLSSVPSSSSNNNNNTAQGNAIASSSTATRGAGLISRIRDATNARKARATTGTDEMYDHDVAMKSLLDEAVKQLN